jgi:hypothetical protein
MSRTADATVACPECGRPATVVGRIPADRGRSVEYLRIRCEGLLALLVPVAAGSPVSPS